MQCLLMEIFRRLTWNLGILSLPTTFSVVCAGQEITLNLTKEYWGLYMVNAISRTDLVLCGTGLSSATASNAHATEEHPIIPGCSTGGQGISGASFVNHSWRSISRIEGQQVRAHFVMITCVDDVIDAVALGDHVHLKAKNNRMATIRSKRNTINGDTKNAGMTDIPENNIGLFVTRHRWG